MKTFRKILFVTRGATDDKAALCQAVQLACAGGASLQILVHYPGFVDTLASCRKDYEDFIKQRLCASLAEIQADLGGMCPVQSVPIEVVSGKMPSQAIIRHAIRHEADLLIKAAEGAAESRGFRALDMELLRKCPTPVWLHKQFCHPRQGMRITVAVDPDSEADSGRELGIDLLQTACRLADQFEGELYVVSCWHDIHEQYLLDNAWVHVPREKLLHDAQQSRLRHRQALDTMIKDSGIHCITRIEHLKGLADDLIPALVEEEQTDLLVMGTVARTGIPGFIIGNTAENVFRKIGCSLLALKPTGYVSPVKQ